MKRKSKTGRRDFLKSAALASAVLPGANATAESVGETPEKVRGNQRQLSQIVYPRRFTGPALAMISYPLGGVGAGSIGLGGRGQLRDWEIFNRADKGNSLTYSFASIWVKAEGREPVAHVLEARIGKPYEGQDGLGSQNAPGLSRLQGATFIGEFAAPKIEFHDDRLPISIALEAGTPFIPLDADESGLPVAALRYRVRNTAGVPVTASIAFSLENPVKPLEQGRQPHSSADTKDARENRLRSGQGLRGLAMSNPDLPDTDLGHGSFALAILDAEHGQFSALRGWPAGRWWNSPLLFWDDFSSDGELGPEPEHVGPVGAVCLKQQIAPGAEAQYAFLLAWHFPNRTPKRCGWSAPKGHEDTVIGNWYAQRFPDAWSAAEYSARNLAKLQQRTQNFVQAMRETTVPDAVKDAALSNLSTLTSTTCFRTADGEFHGFEGVNDQVGCCFGNCTHVWNYETATANLFPSLSHSLRRSAFGYSMDERGAMYFRQLLPDGIERFNAVAADGQMGQIIKVYMDWQLSGDRRFLTEFWPKAKRAIEFAWIPGGWDADRDGVLEGVQHNTYDVEFYGPNPLCGIYYLGALRACEEMARATGEDQNASEYRRLFDSGRKWMDANLFNGDYYIQKVQGRPASDIAQGLRLGAGADDPEHPQYQVGDGCLVDQLLGQYMAEITGLGQLVNPEHVRKTLASIYRYNHKANLFDHDCVERTFALNDEAALVICDYGQGKRPKIPFPYYAEVMTGFEHSTTALMLYQGMSEQGLKCINDIRLRYDGIRRNPWDEAECGHHYARAMAAWSSLLALSGFRYRGADRTAIVSPRLPHSPFRSFWSAGTGWGMFSLAKNGRQHKLSMSVSEGFLLVEQLEISGKTAKLKEQTRIEPGHDLAYEI